MKKLVFVLAAAALMAGETGIRPRPNAADYPASQSGAGATLGAAVLSPDQVKKLFAIDLTRLGYSVIEVGVYPEASKNVDIAARDFLLRIGSDGTTVRPAPPSTIAARLH